MVDNATVRVWQFAERVRDAIPANWRVSLSQEQLPAAARRDPDAVVVIEGPDGNAGKLLVEVKATPSARAIEMVSQQYSAYLESGKEGVLVLGEYLSAGARQACEQYGLNFADETGALSVRLDRPALFVRQPGANRNPRPRERAAGSLRGKAAGRLVRALVVAQLPLVGKELAARAKVRPSTVSKTLAYMVREGLVDRKSRGPVTWVDKRGLIVRWAEDMKRSWRRAAQWYLAPGGSDSVLKELRAVTSSYALSGTAAANEASLLSANPRAVIYAVSTGDLARTLALRESEEGAANVILQSEEGTGLLEEVQTINGLSIAPWSQVAADCLVGRGRDSSVGEMLMDWMGEQASAR